jgi:nucleoside 2-deoxyribosyltransferase
MIRIYLAGPEVFLRDPQSLYAAKREICARHGCEGISPLDQPLSLESLSPAEAGWLISRTNEELMRRCDAVIANMTPFRSASADVGTAYEMGFMRALGRPVLAYSNVPGTFVERTLSWLAHAVTLRADGSGHEDADGMLIEQFEMSDNLMLEGAVRSSAAEMIVTSTAWSERYTDLRGFEQCVIAARRLMDASAG